MAVLKYKDPDTGEFKSLDLGSIEIIDNLDSSDIDSALSANQGRVLNEKFGNYLPLSGGKLTGLLNSPLNNFVTRTNEVNFVPKSSPSTIYFNWRSGEGDNTSTAVTDYYFKNGQNGHSNIHGAGIVAENGLMKSTSNGNTVSIGAQNSSYCHIYNSANIPFYFNKNILVNGNTLSSITYKDVSFSKTIASRSYEYASVTVPKIAGFTCIACSVYYGSGASNGYVQVRPTISGDIALYNPTGSSVTDTFHIRYVYLKN